MYAHLMIPSVSSFRGPISSFDVSISSFDVSISSLNFFPKVSPCVKKVG